MLSICHIKYKLAASKQEKKELQPVTVVLFMSIISLSHPLAAVSGLQLDGKTKIRVEPGLFEWTKWVSGTCLPVWIPPAELATANLCVDTTYRYKTERKIYCFVNWLDLLHINLFISPLKTSFSS